MGEIFDLMHQNAEIQTQLDQKWATPAGTSVSREQSATRLSSTSSVARQAPPSADQQHTQQVRGLLKSSIVKFVTAELKLLFYGSNDFLSFAHFFQPVCVQTEIEQKLQDLNRQTAEARAKLLVLIEQQKQSTSLRVSPAISPVPYHSTSTYTGV